MAETDGKPPAVKTIGSQEPPAGASNFLDVPFPSTALASRAITFKGFLITPNLPREEVVTVRVPYNRAQPPFHFFLLIGFRYFLPSFLSPFRVCPGLGTFGTVHERLDPSLRSPRSPILHRAAVGVDVPTPFSPSCHSRCLSGTYCPWCPAGSPDPLATSPTLFLEHRG
ncbi:hypothetical protein CRG98_003742 [Punica granatum]|uniref:Uncharacterized protein n=1 Tax=Punica granatum TaxID=22663 RepID=A0A2I0L546_PUNGR|nr:hypothetical protein CRG98_003742 [Punica granatum]